MNNRYIIKKNSQGMTLLEVLVALAIFSTAAISIMQSVTQHVNTLAYLEEKTFASLIADNQISNTMLSGTSSQSKTGRTEMAGREWYWQVTPIKTSEEIISSFDVSVSTKEGMKDPIVTVRSYVEK